jgi:tetratricopeptide (TPR) repeat protein
MRFLIRLTIAMAAILGAVQVVTRLAAQKTPAVAPARSPLAIEYPAEGSLFPPDMSPPTFVWQDPGGSSGGWAIQIVFSDGAPPLHLTTAGGRISLGEIDERCAAATNQRPILTPRQLAAHTWIPAEPVWDAVRRHATGRPAIVHITGEGSHGQVTIAMSKDPVGAPIFYRDVPLMPEETEKGVIQPLGASALPLIAWRLRNLAETRSRLLLEGMPTCANCHSFSADGKTLAMDLDGPQNDKGLYAIAAIGPRISIGAADVIEWSSFRRNVTAGSRVGFMSQVSPDGRSVVTTVDRADYVANFKDYRFLQVFYPTRGLLACYSRDRRDMRLLPGADDPRYVHTGAVWSPDGKYLVFARAAARDAYPPGRPPARSANDPNETQIQYDLYRIPFNGGAGGPAEPIVGASRNGKSNSFPKISPDGRWLAYVQAQNGELMRPDSELYIVPAAGGKSRRMRCNTSLLNSWHSFSPNGRWLVFSSKSLSPYTQMFLTHLDEQGNDSPAIRIENATAANRAVNIPEFVNIAADGLAAIDVPAVEVYRRFSRAVTLTGEGRYDAAVDEWKQVVELAPGDVKARSNLGLALAQQGKLDEALEQLRQALAQNPSYAAGHNNAALVLESLGRIDEAIAHWELALRLDPALSPARNNLARVLKAAAWTLASASEPRLRDGKRSLAFALRAAELTAQADASVLDTVAAAFAEAGRFPEAVETAERALVLAGVEHNPTLVKELTARLTLYRENKPFHQ